MMLSARAGFQLLFGLDSLLHQGLLPVAGTLGTLLGQSRGAFPHLFSSQANRVKQKQKHHANNKRQRRPDHQQNPSKGTSKADSRSSGSGSSSSRGWPDPRPLVLPDLRRAVAPVLGRVPPSSSAAAAAAAAALASNAPTPATTPTSRHPGSSLSAKRATRQGQPGSAPPTSPSNSPSTRHGSLSGPAVLQEASTQPGAPLKQQQQQQVLPWQVVASLPHSSPFSLQALAEGGVATYLAYLTAARMGMPSVFDLGVVREQGYRGRLHLLRRERLLQALLQHLHGSSNPAQHLMQQQQQQLQQQQQHMAGLAAAGGKLVFEPSDEQLQELSGEQLQVAADAAVASCAPVAAGATADEVGECLVDYFVFKRCMQVLLLQRQHRELVEQKHNSLVQQQQQLPDGPPSPLSQEELADVDILDAFVDSTLGDYEHYLRSAANGHPSVFTTPNTTTATTLQQQQQSSPEEHSQSLMLLGHAADVLALLPDGLKRRPTHMSGMQLMQLATLAGEDDVGNVVQLLEDFYELKRTGFRQVLVELMQAAGEEAAGSLERF